MTAEGNAMTTTYSRIAVRKFAGALGAEIEGVDLGGPLDNETFAEIHRAFLDNLVICFRDQHLTPDQHKDFGRRFGGLNVHPYAPALEGHPEVMTIFKEKADKANFGGGWHSDMTFLEKPVLGSMLYARDVPPHGGDTLFLNMYLAYEALSDGMKRLLEELHAVHSANKQYGVDGSEAAKLNEQRTMKPRTSQDAQKEVTHPVVRTHPETGRKCLFVNRAFVERFDGWTKQESQPLLRWLYEHYTRPEFTCRLRWEIDTLTFWDNRCTQHYALNDYHGFRREMHRVTIDGDRVF
jgi:taurine dioxygenase